MKSHDDARKEFFAVFSRDVTRARVRSSLAKARAHAGSEDELRDQDGYIIAELSDDGLIPQVSYDAILTQTSFLVLGPP